ncbi:FGGY family carbohydrate kinase [Hydrotalea sp.]|uniref:xylulokinase n=1 Tax=Hydrotalea sp. TaxID=2881279 RepID=UPI00262492EF|nr:FGGY family carbohydrate kinase [Hydrotalea sp.]
MYVLGIDLGTSSVKVSVVEIATARVVVTVQYPETERTIIAPENGWAEQAPTQWWKDVQQAILKAHATQKYYPKDIMAIGIAYQMHGLVMIDKNHQALRNSIIWCDSRAVGIGDAAFQALGEAYCLNHLLNSPGNFTAAKLAWVKQQEPELFRQIYQLLLPGDYIALQLTGQTTTTVSALSEGVFWDFKAQRISKNLMQYFGFSEEYIPSIQPVFGEHGTLLADVANQLQLLPGIPVSYKAGDQPNNALSLNVSEPGEFAATAGTSGVIYGVTDQLIYDQQSRINSFAHVNYTTDLQRIGVLLCINGTGILNSWLRKVTGAAISFAFMNQLAAKIPAGCEGLLMLPFGNGAERILQNKTLQAHITLIDLNKHGTAHLYRAAQEGIAFAFRYGLNIMRENNLLPGIIRAGKANMFLSDVFADVFVQNTGVPLHLYNNDGSVGAAMGAAIGVGAYASIREAMQHQQAVAVILPDKHKMEYYTQVYHRWEALLDEKLNITHPSL